MRSFARRIYSLSKQKAAAKNHLHALTATTETPKAVLKDANLVISQLEKRIDSLTTAALLLIAKHPELARILHLLIGIKGIAETSAIALMGELLLLPPDLSHRQWVKFAGLDPQAFESGKSVHKKTRLAKSDNVHIRAALTMPALSAKQHDPHIKAYFQHLVDNWGVYQRHLDPDKHEVGKRNTQEIEHKNLNFRTWIKRLNRKTCASQNWNYCMIPLSGYSSIRSLWLDIHT